MEWTIEYWDDLEILYVKTNGILTSRNVNVMIADIVEAMSRHQCRRQIVDHRLTRMELTILEYYQRPDINRQIGISRSWRVAMVFAEITEYSSFMETVFINRGYTFRQFTELEEAKTWVLEK